MCCQLSFAVPVDSLVVKTDSSDVRHQVLIKTTMGDIQKRYQDIPYGWREIDIAAVMAMLISAVQDKLEAYDIAAE